jgi:hypothetical protein
MKRLPRLILLTLFVISIAGYASAAPWSLSNSNGGDGYVVLTPTGFQLWGADNGVGANTTTYTFTAPVAETLTLPWVYTTYDCCSSYWDPAGYVLNGAYTQLSADFLFGSQSGKLYINLSAGDMFGFYVYSRDSVLGRGEIAVTTTPEPGTLALLGSGLLAGLGVIRRKLLL